MKYTKIIKAIKHLGLFKNMPKIYIDGNTSYYNFSQYMTKVGMPIMGGWYTAENKIYIVDSVIRKLVKGNIDIATDFKKLYIIMHELSHAQQYVNFDLYLKDIRYRNNIELCNDSNTFYLISKNKSYFIELFRKEYKKDITDEFELLLNPYSRFNKRFMYKKREDL